MFAALTLLTSTRHPKRYDEAVIMAAPKSPESSIKRTLKTDAQGNPHLDVPIGEQKRKRAELEALAGAFADDPLVRPEQPVLDRVPDLIVEDWTAA